MKQIVQNYRSGELLVSEAPIPTVRPGGVLVKNVASVVSPGTERMKVEMARAGLFQKARMRPELVGQVLQHVRQDGVFTTYKKAMARLDTLTSMGYSCAGTILEVGAGVEGLEKGDAVACAGEGYACHAETVFVPSAFCVKVPDLMDLEEAAFTPLGAIALQAVRQAKVEIGHRIAVIGLGLMGLLTVQILKAAGSMVLGVDVNEARLALGKDLGADIVRHRWNGSVSAAGQNFSSECGMDAVIIAAATDSPDPIELAGELCREKGRVVVLGALPIHVPRRPYYEKEIEIVISRAFGPGTYDPGFVEESHDYPAGYVRWTATRNMESFLELIATGKIRLKPIVTHRFPIDKAMEAYNVLKNPESGSLGVLFTYGADVRPALCDRRVAYRHDVSTRNEDLSIGFIGAGRFARNTLIPILKRYPRVRLRGVATITSVGAVDAARRFGFDYATTDAREILEDPSIRIVFIATPHHQHGRLVLEALKRGKWTFVEKPLCLTEAELVEIAGAIKERPSGLTVGFNRRFSSLGIAARKFLSFRTTPLVMQYRVNAGPLAADHWLKDPDKGGGRLLGEGCHFVDFLCFICGSVPIRVFAEEGKTRDDFVITLSFEDGSVGTVVYSGQGDPAFPRERFEGFGEGKACSIENFTNAVFANNGRRRRLRRWRRSLGHREEVAAFLQAAGGKNPLMISPNEWLWSTLAALRAQKALQEKSPQMVDLSSILPG